MSRYAMPAIIALGLILRALYAAAVYEPSLLVYHGGEYDLYRVGAELIRAGDWSFQHDLFLLRPPLFSILMAALNINSLAILAANIALSLSLIPLTFWLSRRFFASREVALTAALLIAIDPASLKYSGVLQAEALANVMLALAFVCAASLTRPRTRRATAGLALLCGGFIVLSALARPAAYLAWIPISLWLAYAASRHRVIAVCALSLAGFIGTGLWINHNHAAHGHRVFSTVGNYTMLYYRAVSVMHQATGMDVEDVYAELARRVEIEAGRDGSRITAMQRHTHYTSTPEVQRAMTEVALSVFFEHPLFYVLTIPVGLYRALLQISGPLLWVGIVWNLALLLGAGFGLLGLARARRWIALLFLLLPSLYFIGGTLIVCTSCVDARGRVMITPLLALAAAYGIQLLLNRRRAESASPSPPAEN